MAYPINLVDVACVAMAAACVHCTLTDIRAKPFKLWRLGLPPLLGIFVSILILARAVVSFEHDALWIVTALSGGLAGWWRGRHVFVEIDQLWGVVRTRPAVDTLIAAGIILAIALVEGMTDLFPPRTFPRHAYFAAASALCAGYLSGRAWSLIRRAVQAPHVELERH